MSLIQRWCQVTAVLLLACTWSLTLAQGDAGKKKPEPKEKYTDSRAKKEAGLISKAVGKKLNYFESKYFTWCTSKSKGVLKKVISNADKAYEVFARDAKIKGTRRLWGDQRAMVCIFSNKSDFKRYIRWYSETYPVWSPPEFVKSHSGQDYFTESQCRRVIACHLKPHDVEYIAQVVPNRVGFLGTERLYFHQNFSPPWLQESTAAWLEGKVTGKLICFTGSSKYGDSPFKATDKPGTVYKKFIAKTKKGLKNNNFKNVKGLMAPRLADITFRDIQKGYAIVDWMRSTPGAYSKFVRALKRNWPPNIDSNYDKAQGAAQEKAFKKVFKMSFGDVEKAVKAHGKKLR